MYFIILRWLCKLERQLKAVYFFLHVNNIMQITSPLPKLTSTLPINQPTTLLPSHVYFHSKSLIASPTVNNKHIQPPIF